MHIWIHAAQLNVIPKAVATDVHLFTASAIDAQKVAGNMQFLEWVASADAHIARRDQRAIHFQSVPHRHPPPQPRRAIAYNHERAKRGRVVGNFRLIRHRVREAIPTRREAHRIGAGQNL